MLFYIYLATLDNNERNLAKSIFEQYHKLIYEVAYKVLNNSHDAEDTVGEVMINVIKNIDRFTNVGRNDIQAQLVIYSRNAAINLYNKNKRRSKTVQSFTYLNDDGELEDIDIFNTTDNIDDTILSKETTEIINGYLEKLPQEYQDIIELVYGMGYTNVEAARVLNITPNAVGLRLFRAKKRLLELAGGELYERV